MSVTALAEAAGLTRQQVYNIENGSPCGAIAAMKLERATRGGVSIRSLVVYGREAS